MLVSPSVLREIEMPSVADIHALDQKLDDAGLLGREQFVPQRIEFHQGVPDFALGDAAVLFPARFPGGDDDLRRAKQAAELIDHRGLDLGGRQASDRASTPALLQDRLADIVAVELAALSGVGRRHGAAGRSEDQPLEQRRRLRCGSARLGCAGSPSRCCAPCPRAPSEMMALCSPG